MEYKKIENLVYKKNLIDKFLFRDNKEYNLELDRMLIENLNKCIDKNIPLEMNEKDLSKIYKIYLKLVKNGDKISNNFINNIVNLSSNKIDFMAVINDITE